MRNVERLKAWGARVLETAGVRRGVALAVVVLIAAVGVASMAGCRKGERPPRKPAPVTVKSDADAEAGSAMAAREDAKDLSFRSDAARETGNVVGEEQAEAPLDDILDQAYQADKVVTRKVVKTWVTDNEILDVEDVRDLLDGSWKRDPAEVTQVIRPWFMERAKVEVADIPLLLTQAWQHEEAGTRGVLRDWGGGHGFIDVTDPAALTEHKFVMADDVGQIRQAVREYHENNWTQVAGAPIAVAASTTGEAISVKVSWASRRWISPRALRFRSGDVRFEERRKSIVSLTPADMPEAGMPVVVDIGVDLHENWVQVQDEDFVELAAHRRGTDVPVRGTRHWRKLLGLGVIEGTVYL